MKNSIFSKQFFIIAVLVLCLTGISLLKLLRTTSTKKDDTMVIGMMSGWAPFMSINQQGNYEGFDVDVAQEVARRLQKKCEIIDMGSLAPLFIALDRNKIDMIFSGLDITEKRQEQMEMVYYAGDQVREYYLMFWNKIPEGITTIEDLKNYPNAIVIVEPGDSPEKYLEQFDFITKKQISALTDQMLDLQYGKSLAIFRQPEVAKRMCLKNPQIKLLPIPLPSTYQIYGMGIALKKGNTMLAKKVNATIKSMQADGTLKKLAAQWQLSGGSDES